MNIKAKMMREGDLNQSWVKRIPIVIESDHPRFVVGTRLDWGFAQVALDNGYTIVIEPDIINMTNCSHEKGFERSGVRTGNSIIYICPICKESRSVRKRSYELAFILSSDFEGFVIEDDTLPDTMIK